MNPPEPEEFVSQTGRPRCAVEGRRVGDETGTCTVVVIRHPDSYDMFPHGASKLGVRLNHDAARELGAFLGGQCPRRPVTKTK